MRRRIMWLFIVFIFYFILPCFSQTDWNRMAQEELHRALNNHRNMNKAKNVILFIGDGMSLGTVTASRIYKGQLNGYFGEEGLLEFEKFPNVGLAKTYTNDRQVPDSGATATAFLCGVKTNGYTLGVDDTVTFGNCSSQKGKEVDCILKWFNDEGRSTGLVTTSRITHATPAAAYAKAASREWEGDATMYGQQPGENCTDIAKQLVNDNPYIQVLMGGGRKFFMPQQRRDHVDLSDKWIADKRSKGFKSKFVWTKQQFDLINASDTDYILGLFNPGHMNFDSDRDKGPLGEPSLAEMTRKAIQVLQKNKNGFFLMVEGARIDHAHHDNNAKRALLETLAFEKAVKEAMNLTNEEDTLMVVTSDHSHVFNIAGHPKRGNNILGLVDPLYQQDLPPDGKPYTTLVYGNGPGFEFTGRRDLTGIDTSNINYRQVSAVPLLQETHAGEDVPIYARGPMSHLFHGVHEQHYIAHAMSYAACVGRNKKHCMKFQRRVNNSSSHSSTIPSNVNPTRITKIDRHNTQVRLPTNVTSSTSMPLNDTISKKFEKSRSFDRKLAKTRNEKSAAFWSLNKKPTYVIFIFQILLFFCLY